MSKDGTAEATWLPISVAPFDCELELAVIEDEVHALVFPCLRLMGGWVKAATKERVEVHPTHWRRWGSNSDA